AALGSVSPRRHRRAAAARAPAGPSPRRGRRAMRSVLVEWLTPALGPLAGTLVPGWFAMVAMAGLLAALWTLRRARRAGEDTEAVLGACAAAYLAAVAAGIIVPALYYMVAGALAGRGF